MLNMDGILIHQQNCLLAGQNPPFFHGYGQYIGIF